MIAKGRKNLKYFISGEGDDLEPFGDEMMGMSYRQERFKLENSGRGDVVGNQNLNENEDVSVESPNITRRRGK